MRKRWCAVLVRFALVAVPVARAQQANVPRIGYVYPAGGQQGTTVQVEIGGQYLDGVSAALVSGTGIEAKVIGLDKPLTGLALTAVRDTLQAMQKRPSTPALVKEMVALRDKGGEFRSGETAVRRSPSSSRSNSRSRRMRNVANANCGCRHDSD